MGKLIAIEGLDGCGKATQTALLSDNLNKLGIKNKIVSFPNYNSESSSLVKMYLNNKLGENPNVYAVSSFYAADRYISYINEWKNDYDDDTVIICDRYTMSNVIHQLPKLPKSEQKDYLLWLYNFEFNKLQIPSPNLVIYLSVDIETSQKLITNRYNGDNSKKDLHESNIEYLTNCKQTIETLINNEDLLWKTIKCDTDDNNMRSIVDISNDVLREVLLLHNLK